jgi:hypothetical protein
VTYHFIYVEYCCTEGLLKFCHFINHQIINVTSLRNSVCSNIKENKLCICMKELFNAELLSYPRNYLHFMELRALLPHSQEPTTGPYGEPDESCQHLPCYFFKIHFNIIFTSLSRPSSGSFLQILPPKLCTHFSSHGCYMPNHSNTIWQGVQIMNLTFMPMQSYR